MCEQGNYSFCPTYNNNNNNNNNNIWPGSDIVLAIYTHVIEIYHITLDVRKQSQMAAFTRERDNLKSAIETYRSLFDTTNQLINELKSKLSKDL